MDKVTANRQEEAPILAMLFGDYEYDGRALRTLAIANEFGPVHLIDVGEAPPNLATSFKRHRRVVIDRRWPVIGRHLALWCSALKMALLHRPKMIFAQNYFTIFPAWLISQLTGARLVYDAYELLIDDRPLPLRDRVWLELERLAIRGADVVIAANAERAKIMTQNYSLRCLPTYMRNIPAVPTFTDQERVDTIEHYPALRRRSQQDRIVLYQGDISMDRGLGRFIEAMSQVRPEIRMVVAGSGPDLERLIELAKPLIAQRRFDALGRIPHNALAAITAVTDLGLITYSHNGMNNIYCSPNKIFEYAHANIPVLGSDHAAISSIIGNYSTGLTVRLFDSAYDIAKKIEQIINNKHKFTENNFKLIEENSEHLESTRIRDEIKKTMSLK